MILACYYLQPWPVLGAHRYLLLCPVALGGVVEGRSSNSSSNFTFLCCLQLLLKLGKFQEGQTWKPVFLNMDFLLWTDEGTEEYNLQLKPEQIYTSSS